MDPNAIVGTIHNTGVSLGDVWTVLTSLVTFASVVANFTPSKVDDSIIGAIAHFLALNFNVKR